MTSPRIGLARTVVTVLGLGAQELGLELRARASQLKAHAQQRFARWLALRLLGLDLDALDAIADPPPAPTPVDSVKTAPDDSPFLGADAQAMLARSAAASPVLETGMASRPLAGSAAERLARVRAPW